MSSSEKTEVSGLHQANYLNHSSGIASWLFTLDHKRIGVMYLASYSWSVLSGWDVGARGAYRVDDTREDDR